MDSDRFDTITRALTDTRSRRGALGAFLGGTLGLLGLADTAARKKGKGKKKKNKLRAACVAACPATCSTCYARVAGGTLCGGVAVADCALPCASDTDCIGKVHPFCTTSFTSRATAEVSTWGCPAACTSIGACSS
jgi:hypothetical protein